MLTRITVVTGIIIAAVQGAILFGIISWTDEQLAWVTGFIVLAGGAIHSWFNPNLPGGPDA